MKFLDFPNIPTYVYITVVGTIIAAAILAFFSLWAGGVQKRDDDADKAALRAENKDLNASLSRKNDELRRITTNNAKEQRDRDSERTKEAQKQAEFARKAYEENKESSAKIQQLQNEQIENAREQAEFARKAYSEERE